PKDVLGAREIDPNPSQDLDGAVGEATQVDARWRVHQTRSDGLQGRERDLGDLLQIGGAVHTEGQIDAAAPRNGEIDQDGLVEVLAGHHDVLAVDRAQRGGAQTNVLDDADEAVGLDQVADAEGPPLRDGEAHTADQVGGQILEGEAERQAEDTGTGEQRGQGGVEPQEV